MDLLMVRLELSIVLAGAEAICAENAALKKEKAQLDDEVRVMTALNCEAGEREQEILEEVGDLYAEIQRLRAELKKSRLQWKPCAPTVHGMTFKED